MGKAALTMVQGSGKLNKAKPHQSGGATKKQMKANKMSKVDILKKKKKAEKAGGGPLAEAIAQKRRLEGRTEANIAAKVQVENGMPMSVVSVTPQQLAKAKQGLSGLKQKEKMK